MKTEDKIWFLHMLRGVAALIVVYTHWGEMFWRSNELCTKISYSVPLSNINRPPHLYLTDWLYKFDFNFGSFGVALFFLVSGFVIPISIEKMGSKKFLLRRIFRLYPVYAIGLFFTCIILYISSKINSLDFLFTFGDYFKNLSLFRDWFWVPTIDSINWTLENEVKFYLLCAFLGWFTNLKNEKALILTTAIITIMSYISHGTLDFLLNNNLIYLYKMFFIISNAAPFITFMFIGTCFYNVYMNNWSVKKFIEVILYFAIMFFFNTMIAFSQSGKAYLINYGLALIIFAFLYIIREKIRKIKILDFFANISYPLYVLHGVAGYAILSFLYVFQPYPYLIIAETFALIVLFSYLLHKFVEIPFNKIGGKLVKLI